jgi:hypothetical protein
MKNSTLSSPTMATPFEAMKQQRILLGCALLVGFIMIYYAGAPVIPVIIGCALVPAITALRQWFRSRK